MCSVKCTARLLTLPDYWKWRGKGPDVCFCFLLDPVTIIFQLRPPPAEIYSNTLFSSACLSLWRCPSSSYWSLLVITPPVQTRWSPPSTPPDPAAHPGTRKQTTFQKLEKEQRNRSRFLSVLASLKWLPWSLFWSFLVFGVKTQPREEKLQDWRGWNNVGPGALR